MQQQLPHIFRTQGPPEEDPEGIFDDGSKQALPTASSSHHRVHARVTHGLVNSISEVALQTLSGPHADTADTLCGRLSASFLGTEQAVVSMFQGVNAEHLRLHAMRQRYSDSLVPVVEQYRKTKVPKAANCKTLS